MANTILKTPVLRLVQGTNVLYVGKVPGKMIGQLATVPRLERGEDGNIRGFQREEVASHIATIRQYLNEKNPLFPNAVILGFVGKAAPKFATLSDFPDFGHLDIVNMGILVDGQQRTAAVERSTLHEDYPVPAVFFIASTWAELVDQFVRINSSKPLKPSLLMELLPSISGSINKHLDKKRVPAIILEHLAHDDDSPLAGNIKTASNVGGWVTDGTVIRMIESSMQNDLFVSFIEEDNLDGIIEVLKMYWAAVSRTFKDAWRKPPESRLFQSAGFLSLGKLMDAMIEAGPTRLSRVHFERGLKIVKPVCRWTETEEVWNLGPDGKRGWDQIENTIRGINQLSGLLCRTYRNGLKAANADDSSAAVA